MATSTFAALGVLALAGAIFVAILLHIRRSAPTGETGTLRWTAMAGAPAGEPLDTATRLDMIERLAVLGEPWCIEALEMAAREERDRTVAGAIASALRRR